MRYLVRSEVKYWDRLSDVMRERITVQVQEARPNMKSLYRNQLLTMCLWVSVSITRRRRMVASLPHKKRKVRPNITSFSSIHGWCSRLQHQGLQRAGNDWTGITWNEIIPRKKLCYLIPGSSRDPIYAHEKLYEGGIVNSHQLFTSWPGFLLTAHINATIKKLTEEEAYLHLFYSSSSSNHTHVPARFDPRKKKNDPRLV